MQKHHITAAELAKAVGGKPNGSGGWMAHCPAHHDRNASLSIDEGRNNKALARCHAGCTWEQIIDAVRDRGLWASKRKRRKRKSARLCHPELGCPNVIYKYHDADGKLVGVVCRWDFDDGKEIRPAVRDGRRWRWRAFSEPRPPYRLTTLLEYPELPVLVVEGEKAVRAAEKIIDDFVIVTWPGGTNAVSKVDISPLTGREVVLWPDNDDAGRKAMQSLATALRDARGVRIVQLPEDLPDGWDLGDKIPKDINVRDLLAGAELPSERDGEPVALEDFYAYLPDHRYIFRPTRALWPASSVNARLPSVPGPSGPLRPAQWLDQNCSVEQMTWAPGEDEIIRNRLLDKSGWIERRGASCFNLYRPPVVEPGDSSDIELWWELLTQIFPDDAEHIASFFAHRVQRPKEKINHALVLAGPQGIGKDSLLEPLKYAIGPWNFADVSPIMFMGRFNSFLKSVVLRVSEARDLGEVDRFKFYDHSKSVIASPPDVLSCDEKHLREYYVPNVTAVIVTTNDTLTALYLPEDDRRHYIAVSEVTKDKFVKNYWKRLWRWYRRCGLRNVAAWLADRDLERFDAKAPPPHTRGWHAIVDAGRTPEDAELADILDRLDWPAAITIEDIADRARESFENWLRDRKNSRQIPHRMDGVGYVAARNEAAKDGLWVVDGRRRVIYARKQLPLCQRIPAARARKAEE